MIPEASASALHAVIVSKWSSEIKTWSSCVHLLVMWWRCLGMPEGSAKLRPSSATALIRILVSRPLPWWVLHG